MANRFNALFLSGKHLDNNGSFHFAYATIRSADYGITDIEFERGVRMLQHDHPNERALAQFLSDNYYEILTRDEWNSLIDSLDISGNVPNNNFISTRETKDKWDPCRIIY